MSSLSIEMQSGSLCIESSHSNSYVSGCLLLKIKSNDKDDRSFSCALHDSRSSIRVVGKEKIEQYDNDTIVMDDTYNLSSSGWQYHSAYQGHILFFDLPLSGDIPIFFISDRGIIEYSLVATVQFCDLTELYAVHPLNLYRGLSTQSNILSSSPSSSFSTTSSFSSLSPSFLTSSTATASSSSISFPLLPSHSNGFNNRSRLCWGMSDHSQWQYELELPQLIHVSQPFLFTLRTRMRCFSESCNASLSRKKNASLESCMIGVQLYESVQIGSSSTTHKILMTTSHVLSRPSKTWTKPCTFTLDLIQSPTSSTFCGSRIKVNHHLQITLNYYSSQGQSDRICFECIVPLIAFPFPGDHVVDAMTKMVIQKQVNDKAIPVWVDQAPGLIFDNHDTYLL